MSTLVLSLIHIYRLVRISPFDASGRRHTSFASVEVLPELPDDNTVEIDPEDIKMEVFRSSGAGGQHKMCIRDRRRGSRGL